MSTPTTAETLLLDTEPQYTNLYLSVYDPTIAMICTISGSSYSQVNQSINYYNPVSGTYADVDSLSHHVALIGTTPNSDDIGRSWLRSITASSLRFVESDHIDWSSAIYVTILKYTEIIPLFPRIIQDPSDDENVIFYKVWDIPYTNQNTIMGTFICMGSNYAGFLENGTGTCYWSASGSSNVIGDDFTHSWIFEGATITGSTAHTPGYVAWNTTGHHRVIYSATSDSGRVDTSIRYVSWYNRPEAGTNVPILNWELIDFSGHRDNIGYTCRIRIREDISKTKLMDGALVVIFGEDWYGNTKQSINNSQKGRENIKFVGYIAAGTIQYNYANKWVEFDCVSPTNFMELCECFSCSVESKSSPSTWFEVINMGVMDAIYHYLAWQSSVLKCVDVEFKNWAGAYIQYFDADRTSLYDAVNTLMFNARGGKVVSDALGKVWFEQEVAVIDDASTSLATAMTINKKDWLDDPIIDERQHQEYAYIERGGIKYDPTTKQSAAFVSGAPGIAPAYRGKADRNQGWALSSQTELNEITGNLYAYMNSRYPNIELKMRANVNNIDIAPQEKVLLNIAIDDTPRRITFTNKAFVVRGKVLNWDANTKRLGATLSLAEITQGFAGDTIIIPVEPPGVEEPEPPDEEPPEPPAPPDPPDPPPAPSGVDAVVSQGDDVRTTLDLDQASPTWSTKI